MEQGENSKKWLITEDIAEYLYCIISEVIYLASNGSLSIYKIGGKNRYLLKEMDQFMEEGEGGLRCLGKN